MLRIALPNKGALAGGAAQMLREAGYRQRSHDTELVCRDPDNDVEFFYLRPRDITTYVGSGDLQLGITGRDLLADAGGPAVELLDLGFGAATFRFAARPETVSDLGQLAGRRIATAYPGVVGAHLARHGIEAEVIRLDGAVENAVRLGVADVIADVVQTGSTLRQAGLVPVGEPVLESTAILIGGPGPGALSGAGAQRFRPTPAPGSGAGAEATDLAKADGGLAALLRRLQGVLVARQYVLLAYDVPADRVEAACTLTPGIESPTISPLHREGWVAVQAMVRRAEVHRIMDELYELGARAILVTDIHACRL